MVYSRYMFYFLIPYLPEIVMRSNDFAMLAATLRGRKAGVKNRNNLTKEDLDVFKYSIATWGNMFVIKVCITLYIFLIAIYDLLLIFHCMFCRSPCSQS